MKTAGRHSADAGSCTGGELHSDNPRMRVRLWCLRSRAGSLLPKCRRRRLLPSTGKILSDLVLPTQIFAEVLAPRSRASGRGKETAGERAICRRGYSSKGSSRFGKVVSPCSIPRPQSGCSSGQRHSMLRRMPATPRNLTAAPTRLRASIVSAVPSYPELSSQHLRVASPDVRLRHGPG